MLRWLTAHVLFGVPQLWLLALISLVLRKSFPAEGLIDSCVLLFFSTTLMGSTLYQRKRLRRQRGHDPLLSSALAFVIGLAAATIFILTYLDFEVAVGVSAFVQITLAGVAAGFSILSDPDLLAGR